VLLLIAYASMTLVAFNVHAVYLTILIPIGMGSTALAIFIWLLAVRRDLKEKGVL
jgi:hypothetical protein